MGEVMIPPWVLPESPETIRWLDDATQVFQPAFGRGMTQRGSMADPRWGLRRKYRGLRSDQLAAIRSCFNESRGQFNKILVTPHAPLRGSFPTSELLTNSTFVNGATGWASQSDFTLSSNDRVLRLNRSVGAAVSNALGPTVAATVVQYGAYAARMMLRQGRGGYSSANLSAGSTQYSNDFATGPAFTSEGLQSLAFVPTGTSCWFGLEDGTTNGLVGDYYESPFTSLARCALVDAPGNLLLRSDEVSTSPWAAATGGSITVNQQTAPDGTVTGDRFVESGAAGNHFILQNFTVSSAAADYCQYGYFFPINRTGCWLTLHHSGGDLIAYFTLTGAGAVFSTSAGTGWSNVRAYIEKVGTTSWYRCYLIGRKTGAQTSIDAEFGVANPTGTASYTGTNALNALDMWRFGVWGSAVPVQPIQSTSAAVAASASSGGGIRLKALPASTDGLLEIGDWTEVAGQLKQASARLNSDASGLGYWQFRPALGDSPADGDPVIINQPFGRFIYSGQQKELENMFGLYGDVEMNLEEVYS